MRNRAPISARLSLDPQLRGNVGVVSEDLAGDLFHTTGKGNIIDEGCTTPLTWNSPAM